MNTLPLPATHRFGVDTLAECACAPVLCPDTWRTVYTLRHLFPHHLDLVLARPTLAQRHHEIRDQSHLAKLPVTLLSHVFIIKARGHQEALAVENRLGLQITQTSAAVAIKGNHVIMDELLD